MKRFFLAAGQAVQSLLDQRWRAGLSMLGVIVGSMAIVLLVSIAKGVQKDVGSQVEGLGVNLLVVMPGRVDEQSMFAPNLAGLSYLRPEHVDLVRAVKGVRAAAPLMWVGGGIRQNKKESPSTFIIAAGPDWFSIHPAQMAEGRVYSAADDDQPVCVIGSVAKKLMFGAEPAVGKTVTINDKPYKVVGVTQDQASEHSLFKMGGLENVAYIPFGFAAKRLPLVQINRIMIGVDPNYEPKALVGRVESALAGSLSRDTFSVLTQEDLLKLVFKIMGILTWLLTGLTSIALFVGGTGIMTVMLLSVSERRKEIGLRKALGAYNSDIFAQFFVEAALLSFFGGAIGLTLSWFIDSLLRAYTPIQPDISPGTVLLALGSSALVGCVFGLIPALSAARREPVQALRSD